MVKNLFCYGLYPVFILSSLWGNRYFKKRVRLVILLEIQLYPFVTLYSQFETDFFFFLFLWWTMQQNRGLTSMRTETQRTQLIPNPIQTEWNSYLLPCHAGGRALYVVEYCQDIFLPPRTVIITIQHITEISLHCYAENKHLYVMVHKAGEKFSLLKFRALSHRNLRRKQFWAMEPVYMQIQNLWTTLKSSCATEITVVMGSALTFANTFSGWYVNCSHHLLGICCNLYPNL